MRGLILSAAFLSVAFSTSAQLPIDTSKVIQVRKEPRHHNVFENAYVRVLDVRIPAGDTSLFHRHSTPSIFLVLGNTKTGSQTIIEPRHRTFSKESIWYENFSDTPRIHRVWNEDKIPFHTIDVELVHKTPKKDIGAPIANPAFELMFDDKPARGYRLTLGRGNTVRLPPQHVPLLVVALVEPGSMAQVNNHKMSNKGDYLFIPAETKIDFENHTSTNEEHFAVFELK